VYQLIENGYGINLAAIFLQYIFTKKLHDLCEAATICKWDLLAALHKNSRITRRIKRLCVKQLFECAFDLFSLCTRFSPEINPFYHFFLSQISIKVV